jgi:hypothetical protein
VYPLASLLATEQVSLGDVLSIDWDRADERLEFLKEAEGALVPTAPPAPGVAAEAANASSDGRAVGIPASANAEPVATPQAAPAATRTERAEKPKSDTKK